jgi:hypothetical protein
MSYRYGRDAQKTMISHAGRFYQTSPVMRREVIMTSGRAFGVVLVSAAFALTSACSAAPQVPSVPTASSVSQSPVSSAAPTATRFERLNYQFRAPAGWVATEGYLPWELGAPHRGSPMFDTFVAPDGGNWWIVVGKRPVKPDVSRDEWIRQMLDQQAITYSPDECRQAENQALVTLDAEQARMRSFHCPIDGPNAMAVQVLATHHNEGWVVMCYS